MPTIGVSIPVPEPHGTTIQRLRAEVGDPLAYAVPTHITILPPTEADDATLAAFVAHLEQVAPRHDPFTVLLRGTGTFRPVSKVVFVQLARGIGECELLEADVRDGPLRRELEFAYHPHVTVAHNVDEGALDRAFDELADFTAVFPVAAMDLSVHSIDGVWRPLFTFPLGQPSDT